MINKINKVKKFLKDKRIAIAFSGGADSTLLTYLAKEVCEDVIVITINNNLFSSDFIEKSKEICRNLGVKQIIISMDFLEYEEITLNGSNRCYLCRKHMYSKIIEIAKVNGFNLVCDGNNISDLVLNRPGILVNYENNIISPFIDFEMETYEIHEYLKNNNIPYLKSTTCLATRLDSKITEDKLSFIDIIERNIYENTDCEIVKFRQKKDDVYICEVDDLTKLKNYNILNLINKINNKRKHETINLKLTEIKVNDRINLSKNNTFKLPYNINITESKKRFKTSNVNENMIILKDKSVIYKNGLIKTRKKEYLKDILKKIVREL